VRRLASLIFALMLSSCAVIATDRTEGVQTTPAAAPHAPADELGFFDRLARV